MIDTLKEMNNKGILSKQCIKRLKAIKSTDAKQARVPTLGHQNKNILSIIIMSFLLCPLWTQVRPFFAQGMRSFLFSSSVAFSTPTKQPKNILRIRAKQFPFFLRKEHVMSKLITTKNECRAWAKSFIAENTFFGPFPGDFTKLIKRVQDLNTSSIPFEVSCIATC